MGTDLTKVSKEPPKRSTTYLPFLMAAIVLLVIVALFKHIDVNNALGDMSLDPKEEAKLQKRLKEIDDSEQYALVAETDGYYPCLHSGQVTYFLHKGEVWKYGVTSKGQFGRYASEFLRKNNVSYFAEFKGNIAECLKQEQIKLYNYPFLPENLARPENRRLPRPPYNPIMR